jgi:predicted kinase
MPSIIPLTFPELRAAIEIFAGFTVIIDASWVKHRDRERKKIINIYERFAISDVFHYEVCLNSVSNIN